MKKILVGFLGITVLSVFADFVAPPTPTDGYVLDEVGVLSIEQKRTLNQTIQTLETSTHHQIGVIFVKSLQGRPLEEASLSVARTWGIGHKGIDNGLLLFVAPNEREMRIEVGRGLEGVIPDVIANRIIDEYMVPAFQKEAYFEGISRAIEVMTPLLTGESVELPASPVDILGVWVTFLVFLVWGGMFLGSAVFEPSKAWWPGFAIGALLGGLVIWFLIGNIFIALGGSVVASSILGFFDWMFSTGRFHTIKSRPHGGRWGGGGWGSGGGFGGGSFGGGFGGGGFGGGGASGRW